MSDTSHDAMSDTPDPLSSAPPPKTDSSALVPAQDAPRQSRKRGGWRVVCFALAVLLLALVAAGWLVNRQIQALRAQSSAQSEQLAQSHAAALAAQTQARQALDALQSQMAQIAELQTGETRTAAQLQSLEQTVQAITPAEDSDSPVMLLGEVDRLVEIAQHAVRLSGNVATALVALESAQNRLIQRNALPQVQQALQDDIERLRAVPVVDVGALAARLDTLSDLLAQAPLLLPETLPQTASATLSATAEPAASLVAQAQAVDATATTVSAAGVDDNTNTDTPWWEIAWQYTQTWSRAAWQAVAQDLHGLIQIRRIDDAAALLIAPEQATLLRDTLQYRVAAARLALLMRESSIWTAQLIAVQQALQTRFDVRQAPVPQAQHLVSDLLATVITTDLPAPNASARAVQSQRELWLRPQTGADNVADTPDAMQEQTAPSADAERS